MQKQSEKKQKTKSHFYQRGVSLLMTFFIMMIALSIIIAISSFIYNEIKIIKDAGDSTVSYYLAYSGIEKAMYYGNRNVCLAYPYNLANNPEGCPDTIDDKYSLLDKRLYCQNQSEPEVMDTFLSPLGCNPSSCNSCKLSFDTFFDQGGYKVNISVKRQTPDLLEVLISSRGTFNNSSRQIDILDSQLAK